MHTVVCGVSPRGSELRAGWVLTLAATVLLSFGVGAATAAFTLVNGVALHSAPYVVCETMLQLSGDPSAYASVNLPSAVEVQARISDAYRYGAPLVPLFAAGALAMLLACARGAARLRAAPRAPAIAAGSAIGALLVAAMLIKMFGLPALGIRAIAFAVSVSLLAASFARTAWKELVPATS